MDQETLYTASKWDILEILGKGPKSPIQLAKLANTSVANVSQQLRMLEMAGIVKSVRLPNREKNQPRLLYSIVRQSAYLIALGPGYANKGYLQLDAYRNALMRTWFLEDKDVQVATEQALAELKDHMKKVDAIVLDTKARVMQISTTDSALKKKGGTFKSGSKSLVVAFPKEIAFSKHAHVLHMEGEIPMKFREVET